VPGDPSIPLFVADVPHDENEVEPRQDSGHEVNILRCGLQIVVATENGISGGEDGSAGVEDGGDAGLREGGREGGKEERDFSNDAEYQEEARDGGREGREGERTLAMEMVCCSMASWMATCGRKEGREGGREGEI